jgi:hypothetical protein
VNIAESDISNFLLQITVSLPIHKHLTELQRKRGDTSLTKTAHDLLVFGLAFLDLHRQYSTTQVTTEAEKQEQVKSN